jgi:hypothetical protein
VLSEKLSGPQLVKKFTAFYGTWKFITSYKSSLPHIKVPAGCPYPEKEYSSLCLPIILLEDPFLILSSHLRVGFPSCLFSTGLPTKNSVCGSPVPHRCHMRRRQRRSYFSNMSVQAVLSFEASVYFYQTNVVTAMKAATFLKSSFLLVKQQRSVSVEWATLLLYIQRVPGLNLAPRAYCPNRHFAYILSIEV